MKAISRLKNVIITLAIIVTFVIVINKMVSGYMSQINALKIKMDDLEKGRLLIERWNKATLSYDKLAEGFFTKDPTEFKTFVDQQSKKYNINVSSLSPTKRNESFYINASLSLRASTDNYANLVNFIKSLEEKRVMVERLRIWNEQNNNRSAEILLSTIVLE